MKEGTTAVFSVLSGEAEGMESTRGALFTSQQCLSAGKLTSVSLCFLIYKMGANITAFQDGHEDEMK